MENKIAIVIGATGLVGKHIVKYCLEHPNYSEVLVFTRRSTNIKHSKLKEHLIDFDQLEHVKDLIKGDDLFSAMGTTIKKAGSQDAQYKIDYTYPYQFAKYARENGIRNYGLVSSTGANP
ncbi:MAG: NAD-dependent epimerase/dehydratase family protein, partial [Schleiferiaceae bacterium]|nr:NAD-dependent epimerase/dehydratase family protein [Schleiferiaceae bacterium]